MMRNTSQYSGVFSLVLMVSACGGGIGNSSSATPAKSTLAAGAIRADPVAGIDANGNGIRDDIEQLVDGFGLADAPKKATLQLARAEQTALTTSSGLDAANRNAGEVLRAQTCMASLMPDFATYLNAVQAQTLNTDLRRQAWQDFEEKIGRHEFPVPPGVICQ